MEAANQIDFPTPKQMRLTRWCPAPAALLWRFWTDPAHIVRWFGPESAEERKVTSDLRVGGAWGVDFQAYGGLRRVRGVYLSLDEPHRLVSTWAWLNDEGAKGEESQYVLELAEEGDGVRLTLTHSLPTAELATQHGQGWSGALQSLANLVDAHQGDQGG